MTNFLNCLPVCLLLFYAGTAERICVLYGGSLHSELPQTTFSLDNLRFMYDSGQSSGA